MSGSPVIERELARLLGISRMPVPDALIQLEKDARAYTQIDAEMHRLIRQHADNRHLENTLNATASDASAE